MTEQYTVIFAPTRDPLNRPAAIRLRALLRIAGRWLGLKCLSVTTTEKPATGKVVR